MTLAEGDAVRVSVDPIESHRLVDEVLHNWHYTFPPGGPETRHGSFSDSMALTHCICYGAAWRMLDYLLAHPDEFHALSEGARSDANEADQHRALRPE